MKGGAAAVPALCLPGFAHVPLALKFVSPRGGGAGHVAAQAVPAQE